jgi:ribonuclease HII
MIIIDGKRRKKMVFFKKKMIEIVPEIAFEVAKKAKDREMRELAEKRMEEILKKELGYKRGTDITSYSKKDQKRIRKYFPHLSKFLLELLKPKE